IIGAERCTLFYGTPNMAQALSEHPDRQEHDLSSLRSGGTVGTPEQIKRIVDLGAREICNIYSLTATYGNCTDTDAAEPLDIRLASVGSPIVDEEAERVRTKNEAPLKGILFDAAGDPMVPTHATKRGVRYRYYVPQPYLRGLATPPIGA